MTHTEREGDENVCERDKEIKFQLHLIKNVDADSTVLNK